MPSSQAHLLLFSLSNSSRRHFFFLLSNGRHEAKTVTFQSNTSSQSPQNHELISPMQRGWLLWLHRGTRSHAPHPSEITNQTWKRMKERVWKTYEPFLSRRFRAIQAFNRPGGLSHLNRDILMYRLWQSEDHGARSPASSGTLKPFQNKTVCLFKC